MRTCYFLLSKDFSTNEWYLDSTNLGFIAILGMHTNDILNSNLLKTYLHIFFFRSQSLSKWAHHFAVILLCSLQIFRNNWQLKVCERQTRSCFLRFWGVLRFLADFICCNTPPILLYPTHNAIESLCSSCLLIICYLSMESLNLTSVHWKSLWNIDQYGM